MVETNEKQIVVLGVGNILLKDEGIGVHVVKEMENLNFPENVRLLDGGTLGIDLLNLIEGADKLVIIDCVKAEAEPGAIFRFRPEDIETKTKAPKASLHQVDLYEALKIAKLMEEYPETIIIGVQPKVIGWGMDLSEELKKKIPEIIKHVLKEIS
ncbi:MAG: HyaD/HybD family hydrogenase maturation endopeptidase [Candidatus Subteraquimicrobiales bacterium]|nr:HyaD/HybD family hydrogenase maturation endopeptidase [Candidatus Subteraquimicrobiales bacterium]